MKKLTALVFALTLTTGIGRAATPLVTHPVAPTTEALNRLNLQLGWQAHLPMDGERDGIATIQVLPTQILIQLRSGVVVALDAETGQTQWRTLAGDPYHVVHQLAYNAKSVFGYHTTRLYALDRATGRLQWQYELPNLPTAAPVADENEIFICTAPRQLRIYQLPVVEPALEAATPPKDPTKPIRLTLDEAPTAKPEPNPYAKSSSSISTSAQRSAARATIGRDSTASLTSALLNANFRLKPVYETGMRARVELPPLVTPTLPDVVGNAIVLFAVNGTAESYGRIEREDWDILFRSEEDSLAAAAPGQHGLVGYFSFQNGNLLAINVTKGRRLWRFAAAGGAAYPPAATDDAVYLSVARAGLSRIDRENGVELWQNGKADKFLSTNKKFVYATDHLGQLVVIDGVRGTTLQSLNARDFTVPVSNEWTDRIILASNDGLVVSLHDRDYPRPLLSRAPAVEKKPAPKPAEAAEAPKEEKKPEMKKPEEKK